MFEIACSKHAVDRTTGPTKDFANKMITDHSKTTSELKPLATAAHIEVPAQMDGPREYRPNAVGPLAWPDG